jgi:hypothetical protein
LILEHRLRCGHFASHCLLWEEPINEHHIKDDNMEMVMWTLLDCNNNEHTDNCNKFKRRINIFYGNEELFE